MTKNIKFSIIMPNYNGGKYLERAIMSFLAQDYLEKELVIVDAKSTDNSHKIIAKYADEKTIRWIQEPDTGLCDAINIGLKHCTGDFIGYSGGDDIWLTGCLSHAVELLRVMNDVDGFMFDSYSYIPGLKIARYHRVPFKFTSDNLLNNYNFIGLQNIFFRADLYKSYSFDPRYKYAMDYELYLRMLADRDLVVLHIPIPATINISDGNLSSNAAAGKRESDDIISRYRPAPPRGYNRGLLGRIIARMRKIAHKDKN